MINIKYDGKINITTNDLSKLFSPEQLPLKFYVVKSISEEIIWSIELDNNMWATYPDCELNDVIVTDNNREFLFRYYWNLMEHGSFLYKSLWLYCKSLYNRDKFPKGLAIGTHDGNFGEWVPVVKEKLSDVVLVEGSEPQYNNLIINYGNHENVECIHDIITTDGKDVTFYEGGRGYTNSVIERVIRSWEIEEIHSSRRSSTSLNSLINDKFPNGLDWLHLDVEGLDAKLIMSLEDKNLPPFIIFEHNNLSDYEKTEIFNWLRNKGYSIHTENVSCLANKPF